MADEDGPRKHDQRAEASEAGSVIQYQVDRQENHFGLSPKLGVAGILVMTLLVGSFWLRDRPSDPPPAAGAEAPSPAVATATPPPADGSAAPSLATEAPTAPTTRGGCRQPAVKLTSTTSGRPCIKVTDDGKLRIEGHVVAKGAGEVTVFVWLTHGKDHRPDRAPRRCVYELAAGGTQTCATTVEPDRPGTKWDVAMEVEEGKVELPSWWDSFPAVVGTQSGHLITWPLAP
ncbi:hypothetical protein [Streptomyces sp. NPDC047315]|uniref:hypothetical protein n=1 Tax=Streptomyces sp. NPDC047315 TaxID=3155142 RepID=UPI0033E3A8C5